MQKWTYKSIMINTSSVSMLSFEPEFNKLGAEGWELIAIVAQYEGHLGTAVFKRSL